MISSFYLHLLLGTQTVTQMVTRTAFPLTDLQRGCLPREIPKDFPKVCLLTETRKVIPMGSRRVTQKVTRMDSQTATLKAILMEIQTAFLLTDFQTVTRKDW